MKPWERYQNIETTKPWERFQNAAEAKTLEWKDVPGEAAKNFLPSLGGLAENTASAVIHPVRTIGSLGDIITGAAQSALPDSVMQYGVEHLGANDNRPKAAAVADFYKKRYGTEEGFKDALAHDPAGVLADAFMLTSGGVNSVARKVPALEPAANIINFPIKAAAQGAEKAAQSVANVADNLSSTSLAAGRLAKELEKMDLPRNAPSFISENADLTKGPPVPKFGYVPGVKSTAAMLSSDPAIIKLEMNARVRNSPKFSERDAQNNGAVYASLLKNAIPDMEANLMQDALNAKTTPLRNQAIDVIKENANQWKEGYNWNATPEHIKPLLNEVQQLAGSPNAGEKALANLAMGYLDKSNAPENIYKLRKDLADKLRLKPNVSLDEQSNAVVNNRRIATELKNSIDNGFNSASSLKPEILAQSLPAEAFPDLAPKPKWQSYLDEHSAGMAPIEQGRAYQNIIDKFDNKPVLYATQTPEITPYALRKAIDDETWLNLGKSGYKSKVGTTERNQLNDAISTMNAIEQAKKGTVSVTGSPTATYAASLAKQGLRHVAGPLPAHIIGLLRALGETKGQRVLDDALLNPEKLQPILDKYHARRGN